jgi:transketolase
MSISTLSKTMIDLKADNREHSREELEALARDIRKDILKMIHAAQSGHPGGALGMTDIFTVLYADILRYDPSHPTWEDRDRFLLSNGHISAVRYASMKRHGFFPDLDLNSFRSFGSDLQGHPATRYLPELENSSGSLGQGLSQAVGVSLGARQQGKDFRVFVGISDGETDEGMTWEAAQAAAHYRTPIIGFMDLNGIQIDGFTKDVMDTRDLGEKFRAFGWEVFEADGHDVTEIRNAFRKAIESGAGPRMILFKTILGKGVSFMENNPGWHGKAPGDEDLNKALTEIDS